MYEVHSVIELSSRLFLNKDKYFKLYLLELFLNHELKKNKYFI